MSLEDQVGRLANAVAMHEDVAVREIIRQRDQALRDLASVREESEFFRASRDRHYDSLERERRRNAALRGVITRMKKAGSQ